MFSFGNTQQIRRYDCREVLIVMSELIPRNVEKSKTDSILKLKAESEKATTALPLVQCYLSPLLQQKR